MEKNNVRGRDVLGENNIKISFRDIGCKDSIKLA
jgi:hypothetical protein